MTLTGREFSKSVGAIPAGALIACNSKSSEQLDIGPLAVMLPVALLDDATTGVAPARALMMDETRGAGEESPEFDRCIFRCLERRPTVIQGSLRTFDRQLTGLDRVLPAARCPRKRRIFIAESSDSV